MSTQPCCRSHAIARSSLRVSAGTSLGCGCADAPPAAAAGAAMLHGRSGALSWPQHLHFNLMWCWLGELLDSSCLCLWWARTWRYLRDVWCRRPPCTHAARGCGPVAGPPQPLCDLTWRAWQLAARKTCRQYARHISDAVMTIASAGRCESAPASSLTCLPACRAARRIALVRPLPDCTRPGDV